MEAAGSVVAAEPMVPEQLANWADICNCADFLVPLDQPFVEQGYGSVEGLACIDGTGQREGLVTFMEDINRKLLREIKTGICRWVNLTAEGRYDWVNKKGRYPGIGLPGLFRDEAESQRDLRELGRPW